MTDDRPNAEAAGRLEWGSTEIARRAGMDNRGRPMPAGSDEQLVSAGAILAEPKGGVFSKWQSAFEFARRRRLGGHMIERSWPRFPAPNFRLERSSPKPQEINDEKGHHDQANQIEDAIHTLPYDSARPLPSAANRAPT
jgi:hypothetical protein